MENLPPSKITHRFQYKQTDCTIVTDIQEGITQALAQFHSDSEELEKFVSGIEDRFGPLPDSAVELLEVVKVRWLAINMGIERIFLKAGKMRIHFISDSSSLFFQSSTFQQILQNMQKFGGNCQMQEKNDKLILSIEKVNSVKKAFAQLQKLMG